MAAPKREQMEFVPGRSRVAADRATACSSSLKWKAFRLLKIDLKARAQTTSVAISDLFLSAPNFDPLMR